LTLTGPNSHTIDGRAFSGTETFTGGTGNDTLLAGSGNNILVGGSGNDKLVAGAGMNLLIAGGGADVLVGGPNQDLLIGGTTTYNNNVAALNAIMAEWTSSTTYAVKIRHLLGTQGGGKNGSIHLTRSTVLNNHHVSTLTGGTGLDWFWASAIDHVTDLNKGGKETKTLLS
jgi:Ca2+-binding RTX toxin-like protein